MRQVLVRLSLVMFCPDSPSSPLVTAGLKLINCSGLRTFRGMLSTKLRSMTTLRSGRSVVSSGGVSETVTTSLSDSGFNSSLITLDSPTSRVSAVTRVMAKPAADAVIS